MDMTTMGPSSGKRSSDARTIGELMDKSKDGILEFLEQNAKWWEQAALACEQTGAHLASGEREVWRLMAAIYRERADMHNVLIEKLRQEVNAAHG